MIIGLDVDGVCADFTGHLLECIGGRLKSEDITSWEIFDQLTPSELTAARQTLSEDWFWRSLPLIDGALDGVNYLRNAGHEVIFVSSPWLGCSKPVKMSSCPTWEDCRREWLARHFGQCELIVTHRKELIAVDLLIDDKPSTVTKFNNPFDSRRHATSRAALFEQPHNRHVWDTHDNRLTWDGILGGEIDE